MAASRSDMLTTSWTYRLPATKERVHPMTEQNQAPEDVEGHARRDDAEDAEGHVLRSDEDEQDDTEGHMRPRP